MPEKKIYYRKANYQLGDGKLYDHINKQDIIIHLNQKEKIVQTHNLLSLPNLIYALNLFDPVRLLEFNQLDIIKLHIEN